LRPQQAAGDYDDLHARPDPALRPRRDLPGGDDVRSPTRRPIVDGLHRSTRLRRVPDGRPRLRALDAPPEMAQPARENRPIAHTDVAVNDFGTVVDHILSRRGVPKINLLAWSWGTTIAGAYAAQNNDKVER